MLSFVQSGTGNEQTHKASNQQKTKIESPVLQDYFVSTLHYQILHITTADWAAQEDTFSQVEPVPFGIFLVADGINQQFVDQLYIRWNYRKVVPKQDFAPFLHPLQAGL